MMEVRQRYGILENPYFLSVCTLEPRKNLASVVRAFCDLVRQNKLPDLKLVLVGIAGWKPERMNEALESAGELRSRIIITGYVPDKDLSPLYSGAMGFVYLSEYEGFGLPPLEAMQCGVPVITSNTSSLPEVVGDAGVMLDPNDIRGLTETLLDLYLHEDRRQELARRSKVRAACFSWDRCVSQVVEAYRAALNAGR
jgi:glycosyltransferase involved in cell wall biosynthesis